MDILLKLLILQQATTVLLQQSETVSYNILPKESAIISNREEGVDNLSVKTANDPQSRTKRQLVGVHIQDPRRRNNNRGNQVHRRHHGGYEIKEVRNPHIVGYGYAPEIVIPHKEGGYEIHEPHGGGGGEGYGHDAHEGDEGGHDAHGGGGGGYGHDAHGSGGGGYGQIDHGYKEPPKYIKAAPYYGPQYSPYDLIAPDKSKKNKKTKYGDDPLYEKGHYKDEPTSHFGGFGGGGSIGYKAKGGYKGSGGGNKGGGGYKGSGGHKGGGGYKGSGGHKGGGGYKGSDEHKGGGGGYKGPEEHKGGGGGYKGADEHKGGGGGYKGPEEHKGGGYGKNQAGYSSHTVQIEHQQPSPEHVSIPYNTYDPHADARKTHEANLQVSNNGYIAQHSGDIGSNLNLNLRGANADVSDMLLYDPYALTDTKLEKVADIQLPNKVLSLKSV